MIFNENRLLVDDSHEIAYRIFQKLRKMSQNLSSAAVVIFFLSFFLLILARSNFDHYARECNFGILKKKNLRVNVFTLSMPITSIAMVKTNRGPVANRP